MRDFFKDAIVQLVAGLTVYVTASMLMQKSWRLLKLKYQDFVGSFNRCSHCRKKHFLFGRRPVKKEYSGESDVFYVKESEVSGYSEGSITSSNGEFLGSTSHTHYQYVKKPYQYSLYRRYHQCRSCGKLFYITRRRRHRANVS